MATGAKKKNDTVKAVLIFALLLLVLFGIGLALKAHLSLKPRVAVIPIHGQLGINSDADPVKITELLQKADKDITVKAIILDINSPGGSAVASQDIAEAVRRTKKPTVAWIREIGASGAFWIATSADKVVAAPASVTGSIGVTASYLDFAKLMDKYGITYNRLVTGKFKDTGTPYKELTGEEKEYIMSKLYTLKSVFVGAIAQNRNLSFDYVDNLATGEIWLGTEAKEFGFVDVIGGKEAAQKTAEQLAGIKESKLVRMEEKKPRLIDVISGNVNSVAYWIGRGIGAEWLAASDDRKVPQIEA